MDSRVSWKSFLRGFLGHSFSCTRSSKQQKHPSILLLWKKVKGWVDTRESPVYHFKYLLFFKERVLFLSSLAEVARQFSRDCLRSLRNLKLILSLKSWKNCSRLWTTSSQGGNTTRNLILLLTKNSALFHSLTPPIIIYDKFSHETNKLLLF